MEYQVSFPRRIAKHGDILRTGGHEPNRELRVGYELDLDNLRRMCGVPLSAKAADLIEVMFAVTKADRICPRGVGFLKPRIIEVQIPVRLPGLWNSSHIKQTLKSLLGWLSMDDWRFRFPLREDDSLWAESQTGFWFESDQKADIILNSGGLDSLLGLTQWSAQSNDHRLIAVTTGHPELIHLAGDVVGQVRSCAASHKRIDLLDVRESLHGLGYSRDDRDSSWRTRALLPMAVGAIAAHLNGTVRLQVFENGIGAIALPMTSDHEGVGATRSMQPKTLRIFSELVSQVLEYDFQTVNNGLFLTKRQAVKTFLTSAHTLAVHLTTSCSRYTYTRQPCGKCTSCILRGMALHSTAFHESLFQNGVKGSEFESMAFQIEWLRTELADDQTAFLIAHPEIFEAVQYEAVLGSERSAVAQALTSLYRTHVQEFNAFYMKTAVDRTLPRLQSAQMPVSQVLFA